MTTASDTFTRANETPLAAPWTTCYGGGANLAANVATSTASTDKGSFYSGSWGANQEATGTVGALSANSQYAGLLLRADASGNALQIYTDGTSGAGHTGIVQWSAGASGAEQASWATTFAAGDTMRVVCSGTSPNISVSLFKNGVLVGTVTGITGPNSGNPGIGCFGVATIDNWSATDNAGAADQPFEDAWHWETAEQLDFEDWGLWPLFDSVGANAPQLPALTDPSADRWEGNDEADAQAQWEREDWGLFSPVGANNPPLANREDITQQFEEELEEDWRGWPLFDSVGANGVAASGSPPDDPWDFDEAPEPDWVEWPLFDDVVDDNPFPNLAAEDPDDWGYPEPQDELADWIALEQTIGANAVVAAGAPPDDAWPWEDEPEDSAWSLLDDDPVGADNNPALCLEDPWDWLEESWDDIGDLVVDSEPVVADANPDLCEEDGWDWTQEEPYDELPDLVQDSEPVGDDFIAPSQPVEDAWEHEEEPEDRWAEWGFDAVGPDQPPQPVEAAHDWSIEEPEDDWHTWRDFEPVGDNEPAIAVEDAWPWDYEEPEEDLWWVAYDDSTATQFLTPDTPTVEDAWDWGYEELEDDTWQQLIDEDQPVGDDAPFVPPPDIPLSRTRHRFIDVGETWFLKLRPIFVHWMFRVAPFKPEIGPPDVVFVDLPPAVATLGVFVQPFTVDVPMLRAAPLARAESTTAIESILAAVAAGQEISPALRLLAQVQLARLKPKGTKR